MLILTRDIGDEIKICDDITIKYLKRTGNQIRLGIEAPKSIQILRDNAIKKESL